uniref:Reverse transcriptase Ty1/copia-type domain-containing protein n=1 Tax=Tanacetum cinerariifolium TaxID=118510 RepID=A0A6L2N0F1_TANCI|nr:hypothetical protein [Tanacetum cinerariifolium]
MYCFNLENIVPSVGLACLIAKATVDESTKWHRRDIIEFCGSKEIKREYSNARTPQQNGVAERKNMTLIKVARTMLADSFLPNTFWAEAVSTACYVLSRPITAKNKANHTAGPKEANNSTDELLQFMIQKVQILVDWPFVKKAIGIKRVYTNKKDERGVVVRNKARLVSQGYIQEERIDYDEVFAHVARIEAIRIFLAFASYMGFIVYQMDVKSAVLYGKIDEEVYVSQPPGFIDPKFPNKVYKVVKALYGLHQALRAWYATLSTFLVQSGYRRGLIDKTLFIKKDEKDIMPVQVYVNDIIFGSTKKSWCDEFEALMKNRFQMSSMGELALFLGYKSSRKKMTASIPIETKKPLVKDEEDDDVDVHLYRSMIGSLMYLTAFRPDIMYAVCACSRIQVSLKTSHLQSVKRIFRYLKGQPKLGLWYPRESAFDLEAYLNSDYARANLDRKSTIGGCQFLVKNIVFHSETKHIKIRHHFIRDAYEKKLIRVLKIHTDDNVADLLTKAFDKLCTAGTQVNTARLGLCCSTMFQNGYVAYIGPKVSTVRPDVGTVDPIAPPTTKTTTNIEDTSRPARSILTLKPLSTIDLKDKGKGVLEEPKPAKKMTKSDLDAAQIAKDAEVSRLVYEEELAELEREKEKRQMEEEASKAAIAEMYDERAKFLAGTIAAQRKFRAAQRFAEIRSRPPTRSQLGNLMMRYLKNMGGYKYSQLKAKTFAEIKGLYERQKRVIDDFNPIDSDDAVDKENVLKEPKNTMIEIVPDKEGEVGYEVLDKRFPIINWESKFYHLDIHGVGCIYYRIFRSDGSSRWTKIFSEMVTRFDRMDLEDLYNLVIQRFIQKQIDESGSHDGSEKDLKELTSPKQTDHALATPEQTATDKETSNSFMAGSLPKTTEPT